jgi:hypothetical protein
MIISDFEPFVGQHCETTATGSLLNHLDIHLSEPMLFGLGQGLGFIYWDMPRLMSFPFLGGRIKEDELTDNLCKNLGLQLDVKETSSTATAWKNVAEKIDREIPVGLKLDCYYLDYFTEKIHFAGHYVAMYGYDETYAYLVDTQPQGSRVKATLANLALARNEKGSAASKNRSYSISMNGPLPDLKEILPIAIKKNAVDFLNPPIKNIGYKGIEKTGQMIKKWFERSRDSSQYELAATLMEKGGTGGALFRNLYRDFLKESLEYVPAQELEAGYEKYCLIAPLWNEASCLIRRAGETFDQKCLAAASHILLDISRREKEAMETLCAISPN